MTLVSSTNAREEKKINAHTGAVTVVRWNHDGSALVSSGEDGDIKVALHLILTTPSVKILFPWKFSRVGRSGPGMAISGLLLHPRARRYIHSYGVQTTTPFFGLAGHHCP